MSTFTPSALVPQRGCLVTFTSQAQDQNQDLKGLWQVFNVEAATAHSPAWLHLKNTSPRASQVRKAKASDVQCGFRPGYYVQMIPSTYHTQKIEGEVVGVTTVAHQQLVFVRDFQCGSVHSIPFELLRTLKNPFKNYIGGVFTSKENHHKVQPAEALRLRTLAHALERWNENTGALSRLEVDPLPHQLQLVQEILRSANLNWMIADDVGLGKTIEVGMLLAALRSKKPNMRILIVTPSGLTKQWQEELADKFNMRDFMVYGDDFTVNEDHHWSAYSRVIVSLDRAKHENHIPTFQRSGAWDLILFDEAHRLTRREYGTNYKTSQRYTLAQTLRELTPSMLLLTATPHQGKTDQFRALLNLLRPEHKEAFDAIHQNGDLLGEMIYRNRKSDVTDAEGKRIFKGQKAHQIQFSMSDEERTFDTLLQSYFQQCGDEARRRGGTLGRSIGFVMTVFRKLAASSHAAIYRALCNRLKVLRNAHDNLLEVRNRIERGLMPEEFLEKHNITNTEALDARFSGEIDELVAVHKVASSFFDGEEKELESLIDLLKPLVEDDSKLETFMERIFGEIIRNDRSRRVLIFTEFRATQEHVQRALEHELGKQRVGLIHGGMKMDERREVVRRFSDDIQVVISTEAGGEGLNMHDDCYTMVNYDLPWNPMRLVQRVGRLYRYGQQREVLVFNLQSPDTLDGNVVTRLHDRINSVVEDLGDWNNEYDDQLHQEILGSLVELIDGSKIAEIIEQSASQGGFDVEHEIDHLVDEARTNFKLQEEMLGFARHFDPELRQRELTLEHGHLDSFVESMLVALGCRVIERQHEGQVWRVQLTDQVRNHLGLRAESIRITTRRTFKRKLGRDVRMMDFEDDLFLLLMNTAKAESFGGHAASVNFTTSKMPDASLLSFVRAVWQDKHGEKVREEVVSIGLDAAGEVNINAAEHVAWLGQRARTGSAEVSRGADAMKRRREHAHAVKQALDVYMHELAQMNSGQVFPMFSHPLGFGAAPE